ncbi:CBS domain-containing protein [Candidatus Woesearchaeota archaeon]|nr:CBS domain-containing protein [Candidatus Woesearchaeota archaeon]
MDWFYRHKDVDKYMTPEIKTVEKHESVYSAIKEMTHYNISCLIVSFKEKPVGIVTERDIMRRVALEGKDMRKCKVDSVMSSPLITKPTKTKIDDIINLMNRYSIRRVVIMDDDELKGIITQTDIVRMSNKYIEIIDIVKLYFFMLLGIGFIAGVYLLLRMVI